MISQSAYTESLYKLYAQYIVNPTSTIENVYNIENYQFTSTHVGVDRNIHYKNTNYTKPYEYLISFGRRTNNLSIRDLEISSSFYDTYLNGGNRQQKSLSRNKNKNIIVVKFSAPGGKRTDSDQNNDLESGEISSNNSVNFRNYDVRFSQTLDLQQHTDLNYTSTYTKHKVNRNHRYILDSNYNIYSRSDNGFVTHQIPYHKDQISWAYHLYNNDTERRNHYVINTIQTGSEFYYTNSIIGSDLSQSSGADYRLIYGNSTWTQIRSGKNWRYRKLKDNSYYIRNVKDVLGGSRFDDTLIIQSSSFSTSSEGIILFKESVVDFNPIQVEKIYNEDLVIANNVFKSKFHNEELNNSYGIAGSNPENVIDYFNGNNIKTRIKKVIYPKDKDSGLKRTRSRTDFLFVPWKDDYFSSSADGLTATLNYNDTRRVRDPNYKGYCIPYLTGHYVTGSYWPLDAYIISGSSLSFQQENVVCGELIKYESNRQATDATYGSGAFPCAVYTGLYYYSDMFTVDPVQLPWSAFIKANSKPFDNDNSKFELDCIKLYKDYSIISEFNCSDFVYNYNYTGSLRDTLLQNSFQFINTGSYNINEKSEYFNIKSSLSFDIKSVIKLRPYKEFYPALKTLQIASSLSSTLAKIDRFNNLWPPDYYNGVQGMCEPFFNPGILYNSIKAGAPVPCPYLTRSYTDPYNTNSPLKTASFEAIFDPIAFMENKSVLGFEFTESISSELYKKYIKNFLEEVRYTFCKNNTLEYFQSLNENDFKIFEAGKEYVLELNASYGKLDYKEEYDMMYGTIYVVKGGANYLGDEFTYKYGFEPCWNTISKFSFPLADTVRIKFTPSTTRKYTLDEIFANISFDNILINNGGIISEDSKYHKISQSFNILDKYTDKDGNSKWRINSKWEFPFLIMSNSFERFIVNYQNSNTPEIASFERQRLGDTMFLGGLWHDFCELPNDEQGLFITLKDLSLQEGAVQIQSASLADMVGFKKEKKRVGELNDSKEISELICIVPIIKSNNSFIKIDKKSKLAIDNENYLRKYIFPPKLDHLIAGTDPVIMFCQEVSDIWSKKDLSYIWQNLLPQNGLKHSEKNNIYNVTDEYILNQLKNKEVYFMIFKCKLRSISNPHGTYGPNWPYDDCSLIELVKIEAITGE